ncbi:MAG TPA: hypothetical protein VGR06_13105 [Actinophytocola sp.]|jgi:hypothetical protein|uniref:hypothetical protein n=1 Tax=Actinophytocola sp. TaxID=1872138 RepID=UPI002E07A92F|nr:hypothetical protein [Actinophytocola sp.]
MPITLDAQPVIARGDVAIALVEEVITVDAERMRAAAAAVVKHWESTEWPAGLVAQSLFTGTDGRSLLTYAQWSSAEALGESLRSPSSVRPDWRALGFEPGAPQPFELHRRVRPTVLPDPLPPARCFPAAFFAMDSRDAARSWVDGLLDNEEENEGKDRAYPGALAANFHVSDDGIFLLSEWASEEEAVVHIKEVIEPLLEYMGQAEAGAGRRYSFHATVSAT